MVEILDKSEIKRRLRWIREGRVRHRPLSMMDIALRCELTRTAVYDASHGIMSDDTRRVLSTVLHEVDVQGMLSDSTIADAGGDPRAGLRRT